MGERLRSISFQRSRETYCSFNYVSLQCISQNSWQTVFKIPEVHYKLGISFHSCRSKLWTCDFQAELHWEVAKFVPFGKMYLVQMNLNKVKKSHLFSVICTLLKCEVHWLIYYPFVKILQLFSQISQNVCLKRIQFLPWHLFSGSFR